MLTPFPPFCSTCHQSYSGRGSLNCDLSCDPSRRLHAICRVSPRCLQTLGINLLALVSSFLQQAELSAVLQPGHAEKQTEGTKEQPENRSSQINSPDGPSLPRWEFSRRPKSERAQKGNLDWKQMMENCLSASIFLRVAFWSVTRSFSFRAVSLGHLPEWKHFLFVSLSYKVTRIRFLCFFIGDPNVCTFLFQATRVNTH